MKNVSYTPPTQQVYEMDNYTTMKSGTHTANLQQVLEVTEMAQLHSFRNRNTHSIFATSTLTSTHFEDRELTQRRTFCM